MPENGVDLLVTDPPYGYKFMGKDWDRAVPSVAIWKECLRVLKPGAFAFIMSAPRQDVLVRMIANLSEAGFKTDFTSLYWTYSNGFSKAKDISKEIAKKPGCTSEAIKFKGAYKGCQLKPAVEVILIVQKPPTEKTQVGQALTNGKGMTWQKDCEIPYASGADAKQARGNDTSKQGRFPANLLVSDNVLDNGKVRDKSYSRYFSLDAWAERNIPFLIVPKASKGEKDTGLENMKAVVTNDGRKKPIDNAFQRGKTERLNPHPTVKPIKLMAYLITMGSSEGDVVLDPFCGSGPPAWPLII